MSGKSDKKITLDNTVIQDAVIGLIILLIISGTALAMGVDSIDSAPAVFWATSLTLIAIFLIYLFVHHRPKVDSDEIESDDDIDGKPTTEILDVQSVQNRIQDTLVKHAVVDHEQLFGVEGLLSDMERYLNDQERGWIISLFGEGGVGKTAVVYETVKRFAAKAGFKRFAWVSAKQRFFLASSEYNSNSIQTIQWADMVGQIAGQLGFELGYSRTTWLDDFREQTMALVPTDKCLIVVDNFETLEDASVIEYFDPQNQTEKRIVSPHKLLLTSRKSVRESSRNIIERELTGLKPSDACQLVWFLGRENVAIHNAKSDELQPILEVTEGNPFLIKLIVSRCLTTYKPLSNVLEELRELETNLLARNVKDYLYMQSLQELDNKVGNDTAKRLMNAFCPRPRSELISFEQLFRYSTIQDRSLFEQALESACGLALIRASGSLANPMYSIHSLLWQFTCGEIE